MRYDCTKIAFIALLFRAFFAPAKRGDHKR